MSVYTPPRIDRAVIDAALCPRCAQRLAIASRRYPGYLFCTACYFYWHP